MVDAPVLTLEPSRVPDILRRTHPWARFVAILGLISAGLMMVIGVIGLVVALVTQRWQALATASYVVLGILPIISSRYLLRFANHAREFAMSGQPADLEQALDAQRSYWKFTGVMAIVLFVFCILVAVLAGVGGFLWMRSRIA